MLKNYLKVTLRNFSRNRLYASMNILGLGIAFSACILIAIYLYYETSFENFHARADRIFRPTYHFSSGGDYDVHWARVPVDYINELPNELPEIETLIRFQNQERKYARVGQEKFRPEHAYITDPTVFSVFDFKLLAGNPQTALEKPYSVVITQSVAEKYFGHTDAVGKEVFMVGDWTAEETPYTVTGVMEDLPSNTHLPVDMLLSFKDASERAGWAYVYALLREGSRIADVQAKMSTFIQKFEKKEDAQKVSIEFQPMPDIHLTSNLAREIVPNGNGLYVTLFFFVGLFILLIAMINFINLHAAMSMGRLKEVGMRKILGAGKKQVLMHSLTESVLYNLLAVGMGGLIAYVAFPYFKTLTEVDFLINLKGLAAGMLLLALVCGVLSGLYPAFILTSFQALEVIKHNKAFTFVRSRSSFNVKRMMVTLQFAASIMLMGSALIAYHQFRYLNNKNLGIVKEQVLAIPNVPDKVTEGFKTFKDRLLAQTGILGVAGCMEVPSREIRDAGPVLVQGKNSNAEEAPIIDVQLIDPDFTQLMGMRFLAGADSLSNAQYQPIPELTEENTIQDYLFNKKRTYLINETAMKQLGWTSPEEAIGEQVSWSIGEFKLAPGPITGVVKDFNQETLKNKVDPLIMTFEPIWMRTFLIKVETSQMRQTIEKIQATWDELFPAYPMEYRFLDDLYENLYKNERVQLQLLYTLSALAIFIAFMGLFSLIAYSLRTRVKEIAIRKVLGADLPALIRMISKEYLLVMVLGGLIAIPISYLYVSRWLQTFAYRIDISILTYVFTLGVIAAILLITISLQTLKSTSENPADTLRND